MASPNPTLPGRAQCLSPEETQSVAYTATAGTITNAVKSSVVRVYCTTDAFVKIGPNPTATTSDMPIAAKNAEYFRTEPGDKVSAVRDLTSGALFVTEMD